MDQTSNAAEALPEMVWLEEGVCAVKSEDPDLRPYCSACGLSELI